MTDRSSADSLNKIFLGEIASVHNYGAFVRIPGGSQQGLVHKSQVSSACVDDVTEVLQKGERVWCKVIKITDDGKLALSMKVVNQGNGADLDPNGVQMHQDELKRKSRPEGGGRKVITLEAVLNTTCTKCGTRGHQARDCFKSPDGKTYELIPEEEEDDDNESASEKAVEEEKETREERKLRKKMKKLKKREKKMLKKQKKLEKRARPDPSEDSEDEDKEKKKKSSSSSDKESRKRLIIRSLSPQRKKQKK